MARKRKNKSNKQTFTKLWVNRLLWFSCFWITFSYVLAAFGMVTIAEALSQTACTTIIGVMIGYLAKAFFETKSEKNLEFQKEKYYTELNIVTPTADSNSDDAVG